VLSFLASNHVCRSSWMLNRCQDRHCLWCSGQTPRGFRPSPPLSRLTSHHITSHLSQLFCSVLLLRLLLFFSRFSIIIAGWWHKINRDNEQIFNLTVAGRLLLLDVVVVLCRPRLHLLSKHGNRHFVPVSGFFFQTQEPVAVHSVVGSDLRLLHL